MPYLLSMTTTNTARTIEEAEAIIAEQGATSWVGLDDEDQLGCTREEHESWLRTAPEKDIIAWAKGVAVDEDEEPGPSQFFTPYAGAKRNDAIYRGEMQLMREAQSTPHAPTIDADMVNEAEHSIMRMPKR